MFKAGIPLPYIKDFLGHSSIDSTSIYAHADNETMAAALHSVDQEALPVKDSDFRCFFQNLANCVSGYTATLCDVPLTES